MMISRIYTVLHHLLILVIVYQDWIYSNDLIYEPLWNENCILWINRGILTNINGPLFNNSTVYNIQYIYHLENS